MAHFAKLDSENIVTEVVEVADAAAPDEATGVAFADMGSIVSNNLRAFGLETTKTNDLVDILVATANSSNQTIQDLGES